MVCGLALVVGLLIAAGCGSSTGAKATTTTGGAGAATGGGASPGGNGGGGAAASQSPATSVRPGTTQSVPTTEPETTTSLLDTPNRGPYTVKQVESLGGEKISGLVCNVGQPFIVSASTSRVSWQFVFVPKDENAGAVSYAYNIPSAGESHSANGSYTVSAADKNGTRTVNLKVSDHVVFHGFDGNIPVAYKFDLVPVSTTC